MLHIYISDITDKHLTLHNTDLSLEEGPLSDLDLSSEQLPGITLLEEGSLSDLDLSVVPPGDLATSGAQGSDRPQHIEIHIPTSFLTDDEKPDKSAKGFLMHSFFLASLFERKSLTIVITRLSLWLSSLHKTFKVAHY